MTRPGPAVPSSHKALEPQMATIGCDKDDHKDDADNRLQHSTKDRCLILKNAREGLGEPLVCVGGQFCIKSHGAHDTTNVDRV